jgi:hypothetical protein
METAARHLLFHGAVVLLVGLLCGIPYGAAILKGKDESMIRAWRLAHSSLSLGATTMFGVAAVLSSLQVEPVWKWGIAGAFVVSGYGFCFALTLEPFVGERGLAWSDRLTNNLVFLGNSLGAWSSLLGALALLYGAYRSL